MKSPTIVALVGIVLSVLMVGYGLMTDIQLVGPGCNVAVIPMNGTLFASEPFSLALEDGEGWTTSDYVRATIREAENDNSINGIILSVDSPGGESVAGEEIAKELAHAEKPVVALIRGTGTSAAYWASLGADHIIASRNSYVGSIGAVYSYLDTSIKNEKEGLTFNIVQSGELKGIGNENKPLTAEEREVIERDVNIIHANFVDDIVQYRGLLAGNIEKLANGAPMLGEMARDLGLIDEVGGAAEAEAFLASQIGHATICY
jgi:protease-4